MYGYMGKMLFINLSNRKIEVRPLSEDIARNFLGGPGIGAKILYDEMPAGADVFGEDSMVGFVTGPMNNTDALFGGRYTVVCKSPVTNGWNDANSGGWFGQTLRRAGYDAVFVRGISENPVYIYIENEKVQILDACEIWGETTRKSENWLKDKHGKDMSAALIGPAGEKMSYVAAVMNDGHRAAARGGPGAVVGSKKLKAVVAKGNMTTPVMDPDEITNINKEITKYMEESEHSKYFSIYGTGNHFEGTVICNDVGIKNWTGSVKDYSMEAAEKLSSEGLEKCGYATGERYFCASCTLGCSSFLKVPNGTGGTLHTTRPEYETMGALGSLLLNEDVVSVCIANDLCNEYGLDTMSTGAIIAWAMECYENGVITKEEMDDIDLKWGKGDAIVKIIHKIGKSEGVGKILAKGSREAARILNKGAEFLVTASGIEEPQHDARFFYGLGRTYLTDPTPGRHVKASVDGTTLDEDFDSVESLRGTGLEEIFAVSSTELMNASGVCGFGLSHGNPDNAAIRNVVAATGFDYTADELIMLGIRIFNMRHAFNLREGWSREELTWPERMRKAKPPYDGAIANVSLDFTEMVDSFYNALGWSRDGIPSKRTLTLLGGLDEVIADLYGKPEPENETAHDSAANNFTGDYGLTNTRRGKGGAYEGLPANFMRGIRY